MSNSDCASTGLNLFNELSDKWRWKTTTIVFICSASVSSIACAAIAIMAASPKNGGLNKSPYRRIIFGLSISDLVNSFAMAIGPFLVPSSLEKSWGIGNATSCQINGMMLAFGSSSAMMYTCLLCFYYLCTLKYRIPHESFWFRFEKKIHILIFLYHAVVVGAGLGLKLFNPGILGTFCHFAATPTGCSINADVECDPVIKARVDVFIFINSVLVPLICFCVISTVMAMLCVHARFLSRQGEIADETSSNPNAIKAKENIEVSQTNFDDKNQHGEKVDKEGLPQEEQNNDKCDPQEFTTDVDQEEKQNIYHEPHEDDDFQEEHQQNDEKKNLNHISKKYRREIMIQASCYVGVYGITTIPTAIGFGLIFFIPCLDVHSLFFIVLYIVILYPIGGFLNILVYTRPKVALLSKNNPRYSRFKAVFLVILSGGEIPEMIDDNNDSDDSEKKCICCACPQKWRKENIITLPNTPHRNLQGPSYGDATFNSIPIPNRKKEIERHHDDEAADYHIPNHVMRRRGGGGYAVSSEGEGTSNTNVASSTSNIIHGNSRVNSGSISFMDRSIWENNFRPSSNDRNLSYSQAFGSVDESSVYLSREP